LVIDDRTGRKTLFYTGMSNDPESDHAQIAPFDPQSSAVDVLRAPAELKREMLLTEDEVARLFRVTVRTIEKWRSRGYLPYRKIARTIRFKWADIDNALDNRFLSRRKR
jgi:excisionase family DNA binding protein